MTDTTFKVGDRIEVTDGSGNGTEIGQQGTILSVSVGSYNAYNDAQFIDDVKWDDGSLHGGMYAFRAKLVIEKPNRAEQQEKNLNEFYKTLTDMRDAIVSDFAGYDKGLSFGFGDARLSAIEAAKKIVEATLHGIDIQKYDTKEN